MLDMVDSPGSMRPRARVGTGTIYGNTGQIRRKSSKFARLPGFSAAAPVAAHFQSGACFSACYSIIGASEHLANTKCER